MSAAKGFDGSQFADDGVLFAHACDADGEQDGHDSAQTFGDCRNGQCHSDHKGVDDISAAMTHQVDDKDECTDHQDHNRKLFGELVEFDLQRCFFFFGDGECIGDSPHFSLHAGTCDHGMSTAISDYGTHVDHVFPVA